MGVQSGSGRWPQEKEADPNDDGRTKLSPFRGSSSVRSSVDKRRWGGRFFAGVRMLHRCAMRGLGLGCGTSGRVMWVGPLHPRPVHGARGAATWVLRGGPSSGALLRGRSSGAGWGRSTGIGGRSGALPGDSGPERGGGGAPMQSPEATTLVPTG